MFFLVVSCCKIAGAQEWAVYKTQYSTVYYSSYKDFHNFTLKIKSGFDPSSESPEKNPASVKHSLDRIVDKVANILDMHPPELSFSIYLYQTYKEVEYIYRTLGGRGKAPISFYFHRTKSIYVSLENITDRILAHEIAHVIINAYFGTPPPDRMQEILAQYVDRYLWEE